MIGNALCLVVMQNNSLVVLDSNILILASKGLVDVSLIGRHYRRLLVSIITEIEVRGFVFESDAEEIETDRLLQGTYVLPLTADIARYAIEYRRTRGIKLPDAAILATARAAGADLLTENTRDFVGRDSLVRVLTVQDLSR